ncbi:MAG: OsmC family protein [Planctomycetaceae bacterium]
MTSDQLRSLQGPLKDRYKSAPESALVLIESRVRLDLERIACTLETGAGLRTAGLHPAAGGDGTVACSAEMLLEALVGCAGTTLCAVATAMGLPIHSGSITAVGTLDFRGTLGVNREVPVGFSQIELRFELDSTAAPEQLDKLIAVTERYCVVFQSLKTPPRFVLRRD